jgi:hypothetical protein
MVTKDKARNGKCYPLYALPQKYHKLYEYSKKVISALKSKTPLIKIENQYGIFMLMANSPH